MFKPRKADKERLILPSLICNWAGITLQKLRVTNEAAENLDELLNNLRPVDYNGDKRWQDTLPALRYELNAAPLARNRQAFVSEFGAMRQVYTAMREITRVWHGRVEDVEEEQSKAEMKLEELELALEAGFNARWSAGEKMEEETARSAVSFDTRSLYHEVPEPEWDAKAGEIHEPGTQAESETSSVQQSPTTPPRRRSAAETPRKGALRSNTLTNRITITTSLLLQRDLQSCSLHALHNLLSFLLRHSPSLDLLPGGFLAPWVDRRQYLCTTQGQVRRYERGSRPPLVSVSAVDLVEYGVGEALAQEFGRLLMSAHSWKEWLLREGLEDAPCYRNRPYMAYLIGVHYRRAYLVAGEFNDAYMEAIQAGRVPTEDVRVRRSKMYQLDKSDELQEYCRGVYRLFREFEENVLLEDVWKQRTASDTSSDTSSDDSNWR